VLSLHLLQNCMGLREHVDDPELGRRGLAKAAQRLKTAAR